MRVTALILMLSLPAGALAQAEKKPEPTVQYEKKTVIDFEDDTIQGDLTRPDGEYVEARKRVSHSNLIQIRENWKEKVLQAPDDL
jgi:hypothetical protein